MFRRELKLSEGDPINNTKIKNIRQKLNNLKFIGSAKVETENLGNAQASRHRRRKGGCVG